MQVSLVQRGDAWHKWREGKIMASDLPIITGSNPWCSPRTLWQRKLGIIPPVEMNENMQRGVDLEDEARAWAEKELGRLFPATCFQHDDYPWAGASLDGFNEEMHAVLEVKCPSRIDNKIPEIYKSQLGWQLFCSGAAVVYYVSYCNGEGKIFVMERDEAYIHNLLQKAEDFRQKLITLEEPDLLERESHGEEIDDFDAIEACFTYEAADREEKRFRDLKEEMKAIIVSKMKSDKATCCGMKITKVKSKGRIDYEALLQEWSPGVDVIERYRKSDSESWRISR
jgi:putative phage-type endonuclease